MLEEIRVRIGQKVEVITSEGNYFIDKRITTYHIRKLLSRLTGYSLFAYEEELKQGFFTIEGGHRVGVVGHVNKRMDTLSDISGLNIRIAHECKNCAKSILPYILQEGIVLHTLLVSSPGVGKTTYLRDCIRLLSNSGIKVGVVDERSEIGAFYGGRCQNDLGRCTDILDNCPKIEGMRMLLRSMSPNVIAIDEIGGRREIEAIYEMLYAGISILGTVHAASLEEIVHKPDIGDLIQNKVIQRIVVIQKNNGRRSYQIYDTKDYRILFDSLQCGADSFAKAKALETESEVESGYGTNILSLVSDL